MFGCACMFRHPKTGIYWFRRAVPKGIRAIIGKTEITKTLGTKSLEDAKRANRRVADEVDALFEQAKGKLAASAAAPTTELAPMPARLVWDDPNFTATDAERLAQEWFAAFVARDKAIRDTEDVKSEGLWALQTLDLAQQPEALRAALRLNHRYVARPIVVRLLDAHGLNFVVEGPAGQRLSSAVLRAMVKAADVTHERHQGDWDTPLQITASQQSSAPTQAQAGAAASSIGIVTVSRVLEDYLTEARLPPETERYWRKSVSMLLQLNDLHHSTPIASVTKQHVAVLKRELMKLPARRQAKDFAGLSVKEIIAKFGNDPKHKKLDEKSVNMRIDAIRAVFSYAVRSDIIAANPAALMSIKNTKRVKAKPRLPFENTDLETLFSQPLFHEQARWEGRQWLPIIALYMGCRLEEIGQLLVADLKVLNGVSYFAITTLVDDDEEDIEKSIKTESSQRNVPLHPILGQLGFNAYVERIRQAGHKRLFPDITSKRRKVTSAYSSWFSRFKHDAGITSRRKVFHSFRHTFKDACRAAGIPVDVHDALTGHARSSVGDGYGLGYPLDRLAGEIGKVSYGLIWEKPHQNENAAQGLHVQALA